MLAFNIHFRIISVIIHKGNSCVEMLTIRELCLFLVVVLSTVCPFLLLFITLIQYSPILRSHRYCGLPHYMVTFLGPELFFFVLLFNCHNLCLHIMVSLFLNTARLSCPKCRNNAVFLS